MYDVTTIETNIVTAVGIKDIIAASLGFESDSWAAIASAPRPVSAVCITFYIPNINPNGTPIIAFTGFFIPSIIPWKNVGM